MKKLNYKRMVEDIDKIVREDFCSEMEMKSLPSSKPFTQKEAHQMIKKLGDVFMISHCISCRACEVATAYKNPTISTEIG